MSSRTSPEIRSEVVRLRGEGLTQIAIAARVGIGQPLVSTVLAEAGRSGHLACPDRQRRDEAILQLRREGLIQTEIARRVGICQGHVGRILRQHGTGRRRVVEAHAPVREVRVRTSHHDILDAWADGLGQYDVHLLTGRSEAAIRQIVMRARRCGDPRAVMRDSASRSAAARAA